MIIFTASAQGEKLGFLIVFKVQLSFSFIKVNSVLVKGTRLAAPETEGLCWSTGQGRRASFLHIDLLIYLSLTSRGKEEGQVPWPTQFLASTLSLPTGVSLVVEAYHQWMDRNHQVTTKQMVSPVSHHQPGLESQWHLTCCKALQADLYHSLRVSSPPAPQPGI